MDCMSFRMEEAFTETEFVRKLARLFKAPYSRDSNGRWSYKFRGICSAVNDDKHSFYGDDK